MRYGANVWSHRWPCRSGAQRPLLMALAGVPSLHNQCLKDVKVYVLGVLKKRMQHTST